MPVVHPPFSRLSVAMALAVTLLFGALGGLLAHSSYHGFRAEADQRLQGLVQEGMVSLDAYLSSKRATLGFAIRRLAEDGVDILPALDCQIDYRNPAPICRNKLRLIDLPALDELAAPDAPRFAAACGAPVDPTALARIFARFSPSAVHLGPTVRDPTGAVRTVLIQPLDARRAVALCVELDPVLTWWRELSSAEGSAVGLLKDLRTLWLRWPAEIDVLNKDVSGGPLVGAIQAAGAPTSGLAEFTPINTDRVARRTAWLSSEQAPLTLVAGYSTDTLLSAWAGDHWLEMAALAFVCLAAPAGLLAAQWRLARRQSEMRALLGRLDLATDAGGIGCWTFDFRTGRLDWTDKMFEIFGVDPARFRGVFDDWKACVHPDDVAAAEATFLTKSESGAPFEFLFRVVRQTDGAVRWVRARSEVTLDEGGRPVAANGVNIDVTEVMEEQARLAEALSHAHEAMAARERFLATLSHELRTPLNAIMGFADLMRAMEPDALTPDKRRDYLDDIHMSGEHLLSLINDMLDLAQLERGAPTLSLAPADLRDAFADAVRIMGPRASQAGLTLEMETPDPQLGAVLADDRALKQILLNLLSNSVKFTAPGGRILVRARAAGPGRLELRVEDDGRGIPAARIADLGQPFAKVDGGFYAANEGAGLGLAIVSRLARAMGGRLTIESELGVGTRAGVILPTAERRRMSAAKPQETDPADGRDDAPSEHVA